MSHSPSSAPNNDTARLLSDAMRALRHQQETAATSVHIAQAVLRAFQQVTTLSREAVEQIPNEEVREHYAEEMTRVTRALAGVVEEFSPGLAAEADVELPEPSLPAPLPEDFFLWMHAMQGGTATTPANAISSGRALFQRTTADERPVLIAGWQKAARARAGALFSLSTGRYAAE